MRRSVLAVPQVASLVIAFWFGVGLSAQTPQINPGGVVNAASYASGPVSPGSIVSIFGTNLATGTGQVSALPLPKDIIGTQVMISGFAAPLFFVSPNQINAQVPWELAGQTQATATVTVAGRGSGSQTVKLAPFGPGCFTTNQQGAGQGAILDGSYRLVDSSHPALAGSTIVQIYCTGFGAVLNQPPSGSASPTGPLATTTTPPTVTIGGLPAPVYYSGLAPGFAGLYQVNAQMPTGVTEGDIVPVVISIGGLTPNIVTTAVRAPEDLTSILPDADPKDEVADLDPDSPIDEVGTEQVPVPGNGAMPLRADTPIAADSRPDCTACLPVPWISQFQDIPPNVTADPTLHNNYYCGPASLAMVEAKIHGGEKLQVFARVANLFPGLKYPGTGADKIVEKATQLGLHAPPTQHMKGIADLRKQIMSGFPVIAVVTVQGSTQRMNNNSCPLASNPNPTYEMWADAGLGGHFVVVVGVDDRFVWLNDPGRTEKNSGCANHVPYTLESFDKSWLAASAKGRTAVVFDPTVGIRFKSQLVTNDGVVLPIAPAGQQYSATFSADGGTAPYRWSLSGGSAPPGLSVTDIWAGIIGGAPSSPGRYSFRLQVIDSRGTKAEASLVLQVSSSAPPTLSITSGSPLPVGQVGNAYSAVLTAAGGKGPYRWSGLSSLPPGLSLTSDGRVIGTPSVEGNYSFTVQLTDASLPALTQSKALSLTILAANRPAVISSLTASPPSPTVNSSVVLQCPAFDPDGSSITHSWSATAGAFQGDATGPTIIWKAPSQPGSATITCTVSDGKSSPASRSVTVTYTGQGTTPAITNVRFNPNPVTGGSSSTATVILAGAAPSGGVVVSLSNREGSAYVQLLFNSITIPAGETQATFPVNTTSPPSTVSVTIRASNAAGSYDATLTISAATPPTSPVLSSLEIRPSTLASGEQATVTITLSGPAPSPMGASVSLSSSDLSAFPAPSAFVIQAGQSTGSFTLQAGTVGSSTVVTVTAAYGGTSRTATATLTARPTAPPTITSISPPSTTAGNFRLTITGSNFDSGAIDQIIFPNGFVGSGAAEGRLVSRSSTQLVVDEQMTGVGVGSYTVKVKNSDGQLSSGVTLTISAPTAPPTITSISPSSATAGNFRLTINGSGFDSGAIDQIIFPNGFVGSAAAAGRLVSRSSTQLLVDEQMAGVGAGTYTVKVKNADGQLSNGVALSVR